MKKELVLAIHSIIDLVTNSSTEIYVTCHTKTVETIKEFVNGILKSVNSDKTADDLFDMSLYMEFSGESEISFSDYEAGPVRIKIISKTDDKDLTNLVYNFFESQEFAS